MSPSSPVQSFPLSPALRAIYADALAIQDACNLSGVVKTWGAHLSILWDEAHRLQLGTDWVNTHPVNVLFASKVEQLTGLGHPQAFSHAYQTIRQALDAHQCLTT